MIPGFSRNWRRTSCTTTPAVRLTARIDSDENKKTTAPPSSAPTKIRVGDVDHRCGEDTIEKLLGDDLAERGEQCHRCDDRRRAMAYPLVTALVVLPTVSSPSRITSVWPRTPPDISAMPWALSAIGPKVSSATMIAVVDSMPTPASATR